MAAFARRTRRLRDGEGEDIKVSRHIVHKCEPDDICCCTILALEPDEQCPIHGWPYPRRCRLCGRFMPVISALEKENANE